MRVGQQRRFSLGLPMRVTIAFAVAALAVSLGLSAITYSLARNYLQKGIDGSARRQAFNNARNARNAVLDDLQKLPAAVRQLGSDRDGGYVLVKAAGRWYLGGQPVGGESTVVSADGRSLEADALPSSLLDLVIGGSTGKQRFARRGQPYLAVGVTVPQGDIEYFEVSPMASVQRALTAIGTSLAIAATVTTVGAAGAGWWASRRLLRPLSRVAAAAGDIATGGLDTRLEEESDPDLGRLARSFNEMADAVQSRLERETRFASDVSHELRSPITALTAAIEVLDGRRDELGDRGQQALDVVVSQVRRFDQMVLDLLEISRLDAGRADVHIEPLVLGPFATKVVNRYGFEGLPVVVDHRWFDRAVAADRRRLERVLANLLLNAQHHGGGPTRVAVEHVDQRTCRLSVEDGGPGIDPGERDRIFERFARGTAARHRVGTGLGLALVAEQTRLQGGRVWVEERHGGGARFVVELAAIR